MQTPRHTNDTEQSQNGTCVLCRNGRNFPFSVVDAVVVVVVSVGWPFIQHIAVDFGGNQTQTVPSTIHDHNSYSRESSNYSDRIFFACPLSIACRECVYCICAAQSECVIRSRHRGKLCKWKIRVASSLSIFSVECTRAHKRCLAVCVWHWNQKLCHKNR